MNKNNYYVVNEKSSVFKSIGNWFRRLDSRIKREQVKKFIKMRIELTECNREYKEDEKKFQFPMVPEEVKVECGSSFQSYNVMNIGEIKIPLGEELTRFSWSGRLPGEKRMNENYVIDKKNPKEIQEWLSYLRNSNIRCHLRITETPIDHDVYLESYSMSYAGAFGDYDYDISFVHAKDLIVYTEETRAEEQKEDAVAEADKLRASKEATDSYTVKSGDCLWNIAQKYLGSGSRYMEIAELNNIENPDLIYPGQEFLIPPK